MFKEIHIKISVHITDSNYERIIRISDHPWKLQFKSTLIFQSVFVLPLKGINTCLWGHSRVQMVGCPANLFFHISLTCSLCRPWSSLTERSSETRGARRGDGSNHLWRAKCTPPAKLLISTDKVWASANSSQSGFLSMWQSLTDRHCFDGWGREEFKMDHLGSAHQGKLPHKGIGMGKDRHLSCHLQQKLLKATSKFLSPSLDDF